MYKIVCVILGTIALTACVSTRGTVIATEPVVFVPGNAVVYSPGLSKNYVYTSSYYYNKPYWGNHYYYYNGGPIWSGTGYWGGTYYNGY